MRVVAGSSQTGEFFGSHHEIRFGQERSGRKRQGKPHQGLGLAIAKLARLGRNFMIRGCPDKNQRMAFLPNSYAAASEVATKSPAGTDILVAIAGSNRQRTRLPGALHVIMTVSDHGHGLRWHPELFCHME